MREDMYALTSEQRSLLSRAVEVWERRERAKRLGRTLSEETITEDFLLDISDHYPGKVYIIQFSKRGEAASGADWAWAFVSADEKFVMPMYVQAKILDARERLYPELTRLVGSKPINGPDTRRRQIDVLLERAHADGWPALYLFYNHLTELSRVPQNCASLQRTLPQSWGISFSDANNVRFLLDDQSFDSHKIHSKALHCLLCCRGRGERLASGSPGQISLALQRLRLMPKDAFIAVPAPTEPLRHLPPLFARAKFVAEIEGRRRRQAQQERLGEMFPGIAGVAIFKDAP